MSKTGEYNKPQYINILLGKYETISQRRHKEKNFWDEAYYEGYINGLVFIAACDENPDIIKHFPFIYLPNSKKNLNELQIYHDELERISTGKSQYHRFAVNLIKDKCGDKLIVHHPPY